MEKESYWYYYLILSIQGVLGWCEEWRLPEHLVFHLANAFFLASYLVPSTKYGVVFMHSALIVGMFNVNKQKKIFYSEFENIKILKD